MNWMLQRVVSGGTGLPPSWMTEPWRQNRHLGGGTGPLVHRVRASLTTAVWFGYDDNRETKSGSGEAAWAWKQFMLQLLDELPHVPSRKPKLKRPFRPPSQDAKRDSKLPFKGFEYAPEPSTQARRSPRSLPIHGTGCCVQNRTGRLGRRRPLRLNPFGGPRPLPSPPTRLILAATGCGHGFNNSRVQVF